MVYRSMDGGLKERCGALLSKMSNESELAYSAASRACGGQAQP